MANDDELARRTAEALAAKAELELDTAKLDYEQKKLDYDQKKNAAAATGAQTIAEANQKAAAALAEQVKALVPDLSKVERGTLTVTGDQPLFGSALATRALREAAAQVANKVRHPLGNDAHIFVTSDVALASSDAVYTDVMAALDDLIGVVDRVMTEPDAPQEPRTFNLLAAPALAPAVVSAVASVVPDVLSMLAAHRTVSTAAVSVDDVTASMAVAAALVQNDAGHRVRHDDIRLAPRGAVHDKLSELRSRRTALALCSAHLPEEQQAVPAELLAGIDTFLAALTTVPEGGKHSPLAVAALREALHTRDVSYVLAVKAGGGSTQQVIDDKALMRSDTFSVVATASLTFLAIRTSDSTVKAGGTVSGTAAVAGKVGDTFTIDLVGERHVDVQDAASASSGQR